MHLQMLNQELHWDSVTMNLIPSLINAAILIFALFKLDKSRVNNFFELFVLSLSLWQFSEFGFRTSADSLTAEKWYHLSGVFILFVIAFGNLFVFRFTGVSKILPQWIVLFLVLLPLVVFLILENLGYDKVVIVSSSVWHWIGNPIPNLTNSIVSIWIGCGALSMLFTLWYFYFKSRYDSIKRKQLFLIAAGLTLPIIIGIIAELIFPLLLKLNNVPLSAPLVTTFSITTLITVYKYKMLDYSPKHHWNDIIETINEGVLIVNTDNEIMYANRAFSILSNYGKEELVGKNTSVFFENQYINESKEVLLKNKFGDKVWVLPNITPYRDRKNNIIGSICLYANIHQMKEAKKNLKLINSELELYVYKASHDLRGPVASIIGLINLWKLEEVNDSEKAPEYLKMIASTASKLDETLIAMVKAMKVKDLDKFEDRINLKELVDGILYRFTHYPGYSNIIVNTNVMVNRDYMSNRFILETVFQNLIENSIKYQRRDGTSPVINIYVNNQSGNNVQIIIHDNGIGIPSKIQDKVFDMYYRGNNTSGGSGLGLYLVKKSVEKLNGEIMLQSNEESGTVFSILLSLTRYQE